MSGETSDPCCARNKPPCITGLSSRPLQKSVVEGLFCRILFRFVAQLIIIYLNQRLHSHLLTDSTSTFSGRRFRPRTSSITVTHVPHLLFLSHFTRARGFMAVISSSTVIILFNNLFHIQHYTQFSLTYTYRQFIKRHLTSSRTRSSSRLIRSHRNVQLALIAAAHRVRTNRRALLHLRAQDAVLHALRAAQASSPLLLRALGERREAAAAGLGRVGVARRMRII